MRPPQWPRPGRPQPCSRRSPVCSPGQRGGACWCSPRGRGSRCTGARSAPPCARDGAGPRAGVRPRPPRAEPGALVGAGRGGRAARAADRRLRAVRARHRRYRRHVGAALGQAHRRSSAALPRRCALQPRPFRQGERSALAEPDAAGPRPLGRARLGAAVPRPPPPGTLTPSSLSRTGQAPRRRDRQRRRGAGPACGRAAAGGRRRTAAHRRAPARPGADAQARHDRAAPRRRSTPTRAGPASRGPEHGLAGRHRPGLAMPRPLPARRCGITRDVPSGRCGGGSGATRRAGFGRWRCCAPTQTPRPPTSWHGSCAAGRPKSPSRRRGDTSASRRNGSGRTWPSPAPRPSGSTSTVTLRPPELRRSPGLPLSSAAWHTKRSPTFSDALAAVRPSLPAEAALPTSRHRRDLVEGPRPLLDRLTRPRPLRRLKAQSRAERSCSRSIQVSDRSASAATFASLGSRSVSKRPIWLVEAGGRSMPSPPTMARIAGSRASRSASLTSSYPARRPYTAWRRKLTSWCRMFVSRRPSPRVAAAIAVRPRASSRSR